MIYTMRLLERALVVCQLMMWLRTCEAGIADDFECSQWAFVHIPKTGGTTVVDMVRGGSLASQTLLGLDGGVFPGLANGLHHYSAWNQGLESDDSVTSFSVVRNPYDWAVSEFFYSIQEKCPNAKCATDICKHSGSPKRDFTAWLAAEDHLDHPFNCDLIASNDKINYKPVSQRAWLTDDFDDILVKHIVHLEDHDAFRAFSTAEGLLPKLCRDGVLDALNISADDDVTPVRHKKKSTHGHRSLYYTDVACEIVARRFQVDFDTFGYDIKNCTGLPGTGWPTPVRFP